MFVSVYINCNFVKLFILKSVVRIRPSNNGSTLRNVWSNLWLLRPTNNNNNGKLSIDHNMYIVYIITR